MRVINSTANMEYAQFLASMSYLPTLLGVMELPKGSESFSTHQQNVKVGPQCSWSTTQLHGPSGPPGPP